MLRNTYSNLHCVYYYVQDYKNALEVAKKEAQVATKLGILDARTMMHSGVSYLRMDSFPQAKEAYSMALKHMLQHPEEQREATLI